MKLTLEQVESNIEWATRRAEVLLVAGRYDKAQYWIEQRDKMMDERSSFYSNEKRFQECGKLEQLWRYRWYLTIPFKFLAAKARTNTLPSAVLWSLSIGEAQYKMKWYYTSEEVKERLNID